MAKDVFASVAENFEEFRAEPEQFIDAGDRVVVVGSFRGRAKGGRTLDAPYAHIWALRGGKAVRFRNHVEAATWAAAWGA